MTIDLGIMKDFNGVDIKQHSKMSCDWDKQLSNSGYEQCLPLTSNHNSLSTSDSSSNN